MLDRRLSTGERTGRAVEVFFIHTRAEIKEKIKTPILISLHKPPPLAAVQVVRMSFIFSISAHTNMCTCYSGVTGPWRYEYTHTHDTHITHTFTNMSHFKLTSVCLFGQSTLFLTSTSEHILKLLFRSFPPLRLKLHS